jgi:hypothetical protein
MRAFHTNRLHEGGDVVGEQFHRIGALRLIRLASTAWIDGDAGKVLGVIGDLEGVAGMVGGKIGNENKRLSRPLLLVVDGDAVGLDFRHANLPVGFLVGLRGRGAQRASDYC